MVIWDISSSGARIEAATVNVPPGSTVRMCFSYSRRAPRVLTSAEVVRCTDSGFAVRFVNMEQQTHHMLEDALTRRRRRRLDLGTTTGEAPAHVRQANRRRDR